MKDCLGNSILPGQMLYWAHKQIICKVLKVDEPQLTNDPPTLTVQVEIEGLPPQPGHARREAQMASLMRVVDPTQEEVLNRVMSGKSVKSESVQ